MGAPLPFNQVRTVKGKIVTLNAKAEPASAPPPTPFVHLQLARFSGCPICNLKLREYSRSADGVRAPRPRM